jgi:ABC-2 type transport system permease protein
MFKLWAAIVKDVRVMLGDKVGLALMFGMPVILVIIVTSIQNSTFQLVNKNKIAVVLSNRDTGQIALTFINTIDKIGMFKITPLPNNLTGEGLIEAMHKTDALLAISIPAGFSAEVRRKAKNLTGKALNSFGLQGDTLKGKLKHYAIEVYYQPILQENYRASVEGAIGSALQLVESRETLADLYYAINEKKLPAQMERELLSNQTSVTLIPASKDGSRVIPNASQHNVPAWTVFAMFFIVLSLGGSIVREKTSGSIIRLKTLPTNYLVGMASKQITYLTVTLIQALVIFSLGIWLFPHIGLPRLAMPDNMAGLLIVTLVCGWCAVSYALCVGVFAGTQEQANGFGAISIVILAAIGGLMVPSFAMPAFFKAFASISPLHWCLEAYYGLFLERGGFGDVLVKILPLLLITGLLQMLAYLGLKTKKLI